MGIDWHYPWLWGYDLHSFYKSIWLGWWLVTWCIPPYNTYKPEEFSIHFQPGL